MNVTNNCSIYPYPDIISDSRNALSLSSILLSYSYPFMNVDIFP